MNSFNFNHVFGKPIQYKNINLYPIKLIDSQNFYDLVRCLLIPKNTFKDVEIIKMSYLKFLIYLSVEGGHPYLLGLLNGLLNMVLKTDNITFNENERGKIIMLINNEHEITENDFDKIKNIICEQNLITIDDQILDPELEDKIKEAREFLKKRNGKSADLEQQIVAYHCAFKMPYEEIEKLTIYQFHKGIERMNLIKTADAIQSARYSGFVTFKDESNLPSWLSYIEEKDPNDDVLMSKDEFDNIASSNGLVGS